MNDHSEKTIFLHALDQQSPADRQAYLNAACGRDTSLRAAVDALLAAHQRSANPLDQPVVEIAAALIDSKDSTLGLESATLSQHIGMAIGPYRLMEQIGEGGFGLVFVAQQQQPVRRKVALKIIKPGTGSKEVLARFAAEQQAVAIMDHPNIAQVFDAGVTDDARPYFVMELVRGVPITQYCDLHQFDLRRRLELFVDVCSAVQHAHQKGVIHRDLKPSNVMVTLHDDKPVVKVIDFGVAKAIGQSLTDKTVYTRFFSLIGTPLYMSPEQAQMSGLDVDTRSDIYSLGVMLYELLTGTTPFERQRLDAAGYDEMRRIIMEEEPPRPSLRLTTLGEQISTVSATRRIEPKRLKSSVRGDLDWIVMKALDKDRRRRYESAAAMADDLRRYLDQQPIAARPPSRSYRIRKFARRNRVPLVTASLVAAAMVIGTGASLWQASQAIAERNEKDKALIEAVRAKNEADDAKRQIEQFAERLTAANLLVSSGQTHADAGRWQAAAGDYSEAVQLQPNYYLPWLQRAQMYVRLKLWDQAAEDYSAALGLGASADAPQWWGVPALFKMTGFNEQYQQIRAQYAEQIDASEPSWNAVRATLLSSTPPPRYAFDQLAAITEQWLDRPPEDEGRFRQPFGRQRQPPGPADDQRPRRRPPPRFSGDPGPPAPGWPPDRTANGGPGREGPLRRSGGGPPVDFGKPRPDGYTPRAAKFYVTGWAQLRAEAFDRAIERLQQASGDRGWPGVDLVHAPLAVAYQRVGRAEEARQSLEKADRAIDRWLDAMTNRPEDPTPIPWFDFVEAWVVHQEATAEVTGQVPVADPRLRKIRDASIKLISLDSISTP